MPSPRPLPSAPAALPLVLALLVALPAAASAPWAVGDRIEPFALEDQHGVTRRVDEATEVLLVSRDMDGGHVLEQALDGAPEGFLEERRAAYVADVSRMPGLVTRLFAIPSLRRRPYPMLLDRDGTTTARLPTAAGRGTLVFLDGLRITRVLHAATPEELARALGVPASSDEDTAGDARKEGM